MPSTFPISDWAKTEIMKLLFNSGTLTRRANFYAALFYQGTEIDKAGYSRAEVSFNPNVATENTSQSYVVNLATYFLLPLEDWGNIDEIRWFETSTSAAADYLAAFTLGTAIDIKMFHVFAIPPGTFKVRIKGHTSTNRWSKYLQELVLERVYIGKDRTIPSSYYAALTETSPDWDDDGTALDEPVNTGANAGNYDRLQFNWTTAAEVGDTHYIECGNDDGGDFTDPTATKVWFGGDPPPLVPYMCLTDSSGRQTGELLAIGSISVPQGVEAGDSVIANSDQDTYIVRLSD